MLKFVPMCPVNNKPALVQIVAWCWWGDKPLSEPMIAKVTDIYASPELDEFASESGIRISYKLPKKLIPIKTDIHIIQHIFSFDVM